MKTTSYLLLTVSAIVFFGCKSDTPASEEVISVEIHETVSRYQLPDTVLSRYQDSSNALSNDLPEPIIGFIDSIGIRELSLKQKPDSLQFIASIYKVDQEQNNYLLVAIKETAVLTMADIQKTRAIQNRVEILFTLEGTRKWAQFTRAHIHEHVAIIINDRLYDLPLISGEIRNGMAIVGNLPSTNLADKISAGINASLQ